MGFFREVWQHDGKNIIRGAIGTAVFCVAFCAAIATYVETFYIGFDQGQKSRPTPFVTAEFAQHHPDEAAQISRITAKTKQEDEKRAFAAISSLHAVIHTKK